MSGRALSAAVVAGVAVVVALVFWTTRQQESTVVESIGTQTEPSADSDPDAHATSRPATPNQHREWFPDLSSAADAGAGGVRDSFNCDMDQLEDPLRFLTGVDSYSGAQALDEFVSVLGSSGDAEMLLAASEFDHFIGIVGGSGLGSAERIPNLERALAADPTNPAILWDAAQLCGVESEIEICNQPWLRANVDTALGGNGEYWARQAVERYGAEDVQGALASIQRAVSAPEFNNFVPEHTRILERALAAASNLEYQERTLTAYVLGSEFFGPSNPGLLTACGAQAESDPLWWDACLELANRFLADGRTIRSQEIGARLQVRLFTISGDEELRMAAEETRDWLDDAGLDDVDDDVISVLLTDERALRGFLDEFESGNELSAVEWLNVEVLRLKQDPEYDPCPDYKDVN